MTSVTSKIMANEEIKTRIDAKVPGVVLGIKPNIFLSPSTDAFLRDEIPAYMEQNRKNINPATAIFAVL
ncbi:MAG: hypothetical protein Q7S43_02200 [bacterium]|nr:hypothetical protein [bacterium]